MYEQKAKINKSNSKGNNNHHHFRGVRKQKLQGVLGAVNTHGVDVIERPVAQRDVWGVLKGLGTTTIGGLLAALGMQNMNDKKKNTFKECLIELGWMPQRFFWCLWKIHSDR